jgi:hypothetical protein
MTEGFFFWGEDSLTSDNSEKKDKDVGTKKYFKI